MLDYKISFITSCRYYTFVPTICRLLIFRFNILLISQAILKCYIRFLSHIEISFNRQTKSSMIRKANAVWQGTGLEGKGTLSSPSTVLNETPYSFKTRFENEDGKSGTNPEELIAAAHAGCFSMALSFQLTGANFAPTKLSTEATITMVQENGGFKFKSIHLHLEGIVPNISEEQFKELADVAKKNCPVSQALSAVEITLSANLIK